MPRNGEDEDIVLSKIPSNYFMVICSLFKSVIDTFSNKYHVIFSSKCSHPLQCALANHGEDVQQR